MNDVGGNTRSARRFLVVLLTLALVYPGQSALAAGEDPATARREVQRRRADAAAEVDVLRASDAEIERALADLRQNLREQETRAAATRQEAAVAATALQRAKDAQAVTEQRLSERREEMRAVAVEAYVAGPVQGLAIAVEARSFKDLTSRRYFVEVAAATAAEAADELRAAREDLGVRRRRAAAAADWAEAQEKEAEADLRELQAAEATQARVAQSVEARLEQTLAEAAALTAVDERLAAEIAARQARLAAQLAAQRPPAVVAPTGTPSTATTLPARSPATTEPTEVGPPPTPSRQPSAPAVTTVRGITVATALADTLRALLEAADADGFNLSGGGYRSSKSQIEARRANCGPTDYDIYEKPASECDPPTARPGHSMHEQGLAVDFTADGRLIESQSDRAFLWLSRNAARFGLYNLPREPWHWSTNGT